MNARWIALLLLFVAGASFAQQKPGPYVNVYHDDTVAFQVRRDRITVTGDKLYRVWLRWLWAEPQKWKSDFEIATIREVDLDCNGLRVRELSVRHKNRKNEIFDTEQRDPAQSPWKTMPRDTGAGAAIARVCEFLPQLIDAAQP